MGLPCLGPCFSPCLGPASFPLSFPWGSLALPFVAPWVSLEGPLGFPLDSPWTSLGREGAGSWGLLANASEIGIPKQISPACYSEEVAVPRPHKAVCHGRISPSATVAAPRPHKWSSTAPRFKWERGRGGEVLPQDSKDRQGCSSRGFCPLALQVLRRITWRAELLSKIDGSTRSHAGVVHLGSIPAGVRFVQQNGETLSVD